jgi:quinoprotein glucose dehydrogenase
MLFPKRALTLLLTVAGICACSTGMNGESPATQYAAGKDWPYYNGNPAGTHYSQLKDINTSNVGKLELAWVYDTHDKLDGNTTLESNPLVVGGRLFFISPAGRLISLEGATGRERWVFDPGVGASGGFYNWRRGVSYWSDGKEERVLFTFADDLYAVDANTGRAVAGFGSAGRVPLGGRVASPGAVYKDLILIGGTSSSIRAFDVRTGQLRWTFHTIPHPGEFGYETWPKDAWKTATGVNNWAGMTLDEARGIVFVPLAFPSGFDGTKRTGDNLFATSLLALDANTGSRLWHFQTVRHDLWDYDLPAPPTLVSVVRDGKTVDAVAQVSKFGFVYVLNRLTGQSLFPLLEKPAFASDIPGEVTAKTQIEPQLPAPFARQHFTADMITQRTPEAAAAVAAQFATLSSRGLWDPPSERGTITFPGLEGGANWGGAAYDTETGLLYVNSNDVPWIVKLNKRSLSGDTSASGLYRGYCAGCHGENRAGSGDAPSLIGIADRLNFQQITAKISTGGGRMPAFPALVADYYKILPLVQYLQTGVDAQAKLKTKAGAPQSKPDSKAAAPAGEAGPEYVVDGLSRFVDNQGYPPISPPWGTLNAIDLNTGQYVWKIPFGEYPELVAQGLKDTGSENYGGAIITAGGILFIGATSYDKKFRAYDKRTGKLLWETVLPAPGNATASTYRADGRQFVVIAAGGGRPTRAEAGSKIVAFALPK